MAEYLRRNGIRPWKRIVKTLNRSLSLRSVKKNRVSWQRTPRVLRGRVKGGRQTHGRTRSERDSRPCSLVGRSLCLHLPLLPFLLSLSLNVYIPGLYFSIVSCITASAGADFAVRRHRPIAPVAAIRRKKGGQRYICLFICRQIQWNLAPRATIISAPTFSPSLSLFRAFFSEHILSNWLIGA